MGKQAEQIEHIKIDDLIDFENHPFKEYTGKRFEEMVLSIKESGILTPLLVRLKITENSEKYEILAGHNRKRAAKEAGLSEVPCVVKSDLSDDEANLIVSSTNLNQRSFDNMLHSERAKAINMYFEALKKCGKERAERCLDSAEGKSNPPVPVGQKNQTRTKTKDKFGLSETSIQRYNRIILLSDDFLNWLDQEKIALRTAVELSYLRQSEQEVLYKFLSENDYKISMTEAKKLRATSEENGELSEEDIREIFSKEKPPEKEKASKFSKNISAKLQEANISEEKWEDFVGKALTEYFERHKNNDNDKNIITPVYHNKKDRF